MKHIVLSLIFLNSIPVTGLSAAASAAVDVKTKVADVSANATANPTATVGNSASAAAAHELEVKRSGAEADVKGDAQHEHTYEQLIAALHPLLIDKIGMRHEKLSRPDHGISVVVDYLTPKREWFKAIQRRANDLGRELSYTVLTIARPRPTEEQLAVEVTRVIVPYAVEHHNAQFPIDLTFLISAYAQGDMRPLPEVFDDVMNSQSMKKIEAAIEELNEEDRACSAENLRMAEYHELLRTQGALFPRGDYDWIIAGFRFAPDSYINLDTEGDRLICPGCGPLAAFYPPAHRNIRTNAYFGDVSGIGFLWRNPWSYHRDDCQQKKMLRNPKELEKEFKEGMSDDALEAYKRIVNEVVEKYPECAYGQNVSAARESLRQFGSHVFLHMDLHARRDLDTAEQPRNHDGPAGRWLNVIDGLGYWMHLAPKKYAYIQDPQAWVEAENKRAAELGSPVRYKLPEKPATK